MRNCFYCEEIYMHDYDGVTAMLYHNSCDQTWEVYYRQDGYAFMFAFGLPDSFPLGEVFKIAQSNIEEYADMFD